MMAETLTAYLIHKIPMGDTSARIVFFTREKGIVSCIYKGVRTPKKQYLLQAFMPLWLHLAQRRDWYYVRSLEVLSPAFLLKDRALFAGLYITELLYHTLRPLDTQTELYDTYHYTLQGLSIVTDQLALETLLRRFEWTLLVHCGYSLSLTREANSNEPILENQCYHFIAGQGFTLHPSGLPGKHILALSQGEVKNSEVLKTAKLIMRQAIEHLLNGKELKTRALFYTDSRLLVYSREQNSTLPIPKNQ